MPKINAGTEQMLAIWHKAGARDRTKLGEMHLYYEGVARKLAKVAPNGPSVAYSLALHVDENIAHAKANRPYWPEVKCAKGCAACCHLHVSITPQEAELLVEVARGEGIDIDWPRVERQAASNLATWKDMPRSDQRCAFLGDDDACRVYDYRPIACRKYHVVSPPEFCDTAKHPGHEVKNVVDPESEVLASAMIGVLTAAPMARQLMKHKPPQLDGDYWSGAGMEE